MELLEELEFYLCKDKSGKVSLFHPIIEINDISLFSVEHINQTYCEKRFNCDLLIQNKQFDKYLLELPIYSRSREFYLYNVKSDFIGKGNYWYLNDKEYWEFLRILWENNNCEIWGERDYWLKLFTSDRGNSEYFMNEDERNVFTLLPEKITVFRGYIQNLPPISVKNENLIWWNKNSHPSDIGYSFTISETVANDYLNKYKKYNFESYDSKQESQLAEVVVDKSEIFAFVGTKNEEEVLIFSSLLGDYNI